MTFIPSINAGYEVPLPVTTNRSHADTMKTRFLHCADIHLGYQQYGQKERYNDFAAAFNAVIDKATGNYLPRRGQAAAPFDTAVAGPVDFVLLAGDLFHKRAIDALTLNQAMRALRRLRDAGIPCIAVEGNHERAYYEDTIGWMKFLALQDLIILLDAEIDGDTLTIQPWDPVRRQGAYYEPKPGVRIYGLRYCGASTGTAVASYARTLAEQPAADYTIFMTHAGVEGQMDDKAGGLAFRQWAALREHTDYVALGHFHKPFVLDEWICNPGSPESCSISEAAWSPRGYLVVDVDTERPADAARHTIFTGNNPRRAMRHFLFRTDHAPSPAVLMSQLEEFVQRKAQELHRELARARIEQGPPVVELYLTGVLPFDRRSLDLGAIEALVLEKFAPLVGAVKTQLQSSDYVIESDTILTRAEVERRVLEGLFDRDARYAGASDKWARLAVTLKQLALTGAPADAILDELDAQLRQPAGDA